MDDVCACGLCAVDQCDTCARPSDYLDDDGTSWCRVCLEEYAQSWNEVLAERQFASYHGGGWGAETASEEAYRLMRAKEGR